MKARCRIVVAALPFAGKVICSWLSWALSSGQRLVAAAPAGDRDRAEVVGSYLANVMSLLHGHHGGEDELLTPRLLDRCPDQVEVITAVAAQHHDVVASMSALEAQVAQWRSEPSATNAELVVSALVALEGGLLPHLDAEEEQILPLAAGCIDVAEWGELPGHGMRTFTGDKLWLILGLIQEQMTPDQIAHMQAHMPPPVATFWTETGSTLFADFVSVLRTG